MPIWTATCARCCASSKADRGRIIHCCCNALHRPVMPGGCTGLCAAAPLACPQGIRVTEVTLCNPAVRAFLSFFTAAWLDSGQGDTSRERRGNAGSGWFGAGMGRCCTCSQGVGKLVLWRRGRLWFGFSRAKPQRRKGSRGVSHEDTKMLGAPQASFTFRSLAHGAADQLHAASPSALHLRVFV